MEDIITREAEEFIKTLFEQKSREGLTYHDIIHTEYVVSQAMHIGQNSGLTGAEVNIVIVAAWFHDSGFVIRSNGHEDESQKIARKFLTSKGVAEDDIEKVLHCIKATKIPQNPGDDMLAKVVCDADMAYLSEDFYI
ncbi:MAG: HD domain-containing protein, partial [Spirochaetes bacterium]|nr:HD domain-containing protein [Spirochaetota bacterium]